MKKICYITTSSGSLEQFILPSAQFNLKRKDWDITFVCDTTIGFEEHLPTNIHYHPIKMERGFRLSGFRSAFELYKFFRKERFDLVQYSTTNAACYSAIASKLAGIPERLYCQWGLGYLYSKGIRKVILAIIEHVICSLSTHVQPDSKENCKLGKEHGLYSENKGYVIGNGSVRGVDLKKIDYKKRNEWRQEIREKYNIVDSAFVFGFVGRMIDIKGINEFLVAALDMEKDYEGTKFLIVADLKSIINVDRSLLERAEANENIIFCGTTREIEKYYAAFDCFVLPSYFEGFGCATIESEAMGLPVIVSDIPGSREAMKNGLTGISIPPRNSRALYNAMSIMVQNKEFAGNLGKNGIRYVFDNYEQEALLELIFQDKCKLLNENI